MSKKLQAKQERRLAEQRRREAQRKAARKGNLVTAGIIAVVVIAVAAVLAPEFLDRGEADVGSDPAAAECSPIETHPSEGNDHVDEGTDVHYKTIPPTSGNHYPTPADPGFYSNELPEETLVHNLEHGQIVFWYRPDAPQKVRDEIESVVGQEPIASLAVPYKKVPDNYNFSMTAWGASQSCTQVSQEVIDRFRTRFQGRGPEQVGVPTFP
jgi:Protein of unknown function (DUF3105)